MSCRIVSILGASGGPSRLRGWNLIENARRSANPNFRSCAPLPLGGPVLFLRSPGDNRAVLLHWLTLFARLHDAALLSACGCDQK
eukprot:2594172-Pyramimonas_sp.AAC.1